MDAELSRTRLLTKVVLLHLRYVFGYLAFGYLVSAPIQLGIRGELHVHALKSFALGLSCVVPFLILYPFTIIDWARMRLPEFKNLELALTRWATLGAFVFLLFAWGVELLARVKALDEEGWLVWICDREVAWLTLGLMFFAWVRVKFHTLLFREFYTLKPEDDLVLRVPPSRLKLKLTGKLSRAEAPTPDKE